MVRQVKKQHEDSQFLLKSFNETEPVERIAVLMFACNRPSVKVSLDSLLKARYDEKKFPVFVSLVSKPHSRLIFIPFPFPTNGRLNNHFLYF